MAKRKRSPGRPVEPDSLRQRGLERHLHPRQVFHWPEEQLERVRRYAERHHAGQIAPAIRALIDLGLSKH